MDTRNITNRSDCVAANYRWVHHKYNFDNLGQVRAARCPLICPAPGGDSSSVPMALGSQTCLAPVLPCQDRDFFPNLGFLVHKMGREHCPSQVA